MTRVVVTYACDDTVTTYPEIAGPSVSTQLFDGGRALVIVRDRKGGRTLREVHFTRAIAIDKEIDDE